MTHHEWRKAAVQYLGERSRDWCNSEILAMLRHTLPGHRLWNIAHDANFWA